VTKNEIIKCFEQNKLNNTAPVIVHSSLKSIGNTDAKELLDALIEYFSGGLLCIPTHTWGYMDDSSVPTLDLCEPKSNIGVLPSLAARDERGTRTLHPTHSMKVFGDREKVLNFIKNEEKSQTYTSPDGCYGNIFKMGGYVLLLGVGQDKNTCLHCVEEMLGVSNRLTDKTINVTIKHKNGSIEDRIIYPIESEGIEDVSEQFTNYEAPFRYHDCIQDFVLGEAKCQFCNAQRMLETMRLIFERSNGRELLFDKTPIPKEYYI
jgi:aminoglycoside 3-N-acetyltransferase